MTVVRVTFVRSYDRKEENEEMEINRKEEEEKDRKNTREKTEKIEAKKAAKTGDMRKKKLGIEEDQGWKLSKTLETDKAVGVTGLGNFIKCCCPHNLLQVLHEFFSGSPSQITCP